MNNDRFWGSFGKSVATGIVFATLIAVVELISFWLPWTKTFEIKDFVLWFLQLLGGVTLLFGILGLVFNIADNENRKSGFTDDRT